MSELGLAGHMRRVGVGLGALALAVGVFGACSSSKSSSSAGATSSSGTSKAGSSDPAAQLQDLSKAVQNAEHSTFKAVYKLTANNQAPQNVTIEQKPPKSALITSDGKQINDGTTSYYCATQNGSTTCLSQGANNPLAAIAAAFSPSTALGALQQAQAQIAARSAGYSADFSTQTFAGQSSNCVTVNGGGTTGKYCVTKDGILAYSGTPTSNFELTEYSKDVPDSEFALPAGASTVTLPGG